MLKMLRTEAQVPAVWVTAAAFLLFGKGWFAVASGRPALTLLLFGWLFAAILWSAFGVCATPSISPRSSASPTAR